MPSALNLPFQHLLLQSPAAGRAQASTGSSWKAFFCPHKQPNADAATVNDPNLWWLFPVLAQKVFWLYFEGSQEQWYILDNSGKTQTAEKNICRPFDCKQHETNRKVAAFLAHFSWVQSMNTTESQIASHLDIARGPERALDHLFLDFFKSSSIKMM